MKGRVFSFIGCSFNRFPNKKPLLNTKKTTKQKLNKLTLIKAINITKP